MPGVYIFLKNDGRVSNLCQPSDPFSDLYFFLFFEGFEIVINPPTPFQIYIFIIFIGVRNRDQPSDPFSDLYFFVFLFFG